MQSHLIIGNLFSLLAAICVAVSVIRKNKNELILWQLWSIILSTFSCLALGAYAATITCITDMIRNALAYKNRLTSQLTAFLVLLCIVISLWINNLGIIGILAIVASASYTIFMYTTINEQQMRWALVLNQTLWFIHDLYIQAFPAVAVAVTLIIWTSIQIFRHRNK